ncbi:MAG TPA: diguanylate cyclase [Nitrospirota bacterium]|nr:diguanylate cyclase [Nitrospirota bacterium]
MKILVIDDSEAVRATLRDILVSAGYDVEVAEDGEDGLAKAKAQRPSLVITDVLMPGLDGFQFLRKVKGDAALRDVPVIFYTGSYLDQKDQELARRIGVSRYMIKPVKAPEIIRTVKEVLSEGQQGHLSGTSPLPLEEPVFLKVYNERLVGKLKSTIQENERARLFLECIMEGMGDGVIVIARDYTILDTNVAAAASLGVEKSDMLGRKCFEVTHRRQAHCEGMEIVCPHTQIFERDEKIVKVLHTHYDANGDERQVEITASPVKNRYGEIFAMVETHRDIMEKKSDDELVKLIKRLNETRTHLKQAAITDDLTGLRNRRYIVERLEEEFLRAKRTGRPLSLIMLDIDNFKKINDLNGHPFGDLVLQIVSVRMKEALRKHDLIGRVGGEEFLVVCPESTLDDAAVVAERIRKIIHREVISDGVRKAVVALSAGVTMLRDDDKSSDKFFSRADTALYKAKEQGRNQVAVLP